MDFAQTDESPLQQKFLREMWNNQLAAEHSAGIQVKHSIFILSPNANGKQVVVIIIIIVMTRGT